MFCNECGEQLDYDDKFCNNCSSPVRSTKPSRSSKQSKPPKPRIVPSREGSEDMDLESPEDELEIEEQIEESETEEHSEPIDKDNEDSDNHHDHSRKRPLKYKCPICGRELRYIKDYNDYWCEYCRVYPSRARAMVSASKSSTVRAIYSIALLTSLVGGILLLFTDFGGWHNYDYYNKIRTYGNIGPYASPFAFAAFFLVAFGLFYCSIISLKGIRMGEYLSKRLVLSGFIVALIVLIIICIGAGALFALVDASDVWLDAGFYGGAIGSLLTIIFFGLNLKNTVPVQGQTGPANFGFDQRYNEE